PLGQSLQHRASAFAALLPRPAADDVDRLVEAFGVAARGDLGQRALPQLRVAVAAHALEQEPAAQFPGGVVVPGGLGPAAAVRGYPRPGQGGPDVLLLRRQILDRDAPELALEDLPATLLVVG